MPPKKQIPKNLVILVVDTGVNVSDFEKVKQCAFNIYKGKLFKEKSCDEVAVVVLGTEIAENSQNIDNVSVAGTPSIPSGKVLKSIYTLGQSNITSDWLKGIEVAVGLLDLTGGKSYAKKTIVVISDFECDVNQESINSVVQSLSVNSLDMIFIGLDEQSFSKQWPKRFECISKLINLPSVEVNTYETCLSQTFLTPQEVRNSVAWNVTFNLGDIVIPITGYKMMGTEYKSNIWNMIIKDKEEHIASSRIYKQSNDPDQKVLEVEDMVKAYYYGDTLIPMSEAESKALSYESGERGLQLFCFTKKDNIPKFMIEEDTAYVITVSEKSQDNYLLISLIKELITLNYVAIVRQVYSKNGSPTIQVMFPYAELVEDDEEEMDSGTKSYKYFFIMVHLPFSQQMNNIKVPEVMKFSNHYSQHNADFTSEEEESMEDYITSLNLAKFAEYEEDIQYLPEVTRDPSTQVLSHYQLMKYIQPEVDITNIQIPEPITNLYTPDQRVNKVAEELKERLDFVKNKGETSVKKEAGI